MFTSKTETYLPKEDIEGYYNINEEQEPTTKNSNIKEKKPNNNGFITNINV
jgi:hypothetical protein